jgi:hypothetical protein
MVASTHTTQRIHSVLYTDQISLARSGVASFANLTIDVVGGHSVIPSAATGASTIRVLNQTALTAGDFLFV